LGGWAIYRLYQRDGRGVVGWWMRWRGEAWGVWVVEVEGWGCRGGWCEGRSKVSGG